MQSSPNKKGDHSLGPDYFTGWKLNALNHKFSFIPLFFANISADHLSKTLTSFGSQQPYRVVYMGPRHTSNFKAFKAYGRGVTFEESISKQQQQMYGQFMLKYDFKFVNDKQKVFTIRPLEYRLFTGMNPTVKKEDLRFDANFECANLDLAISINSFQYDLLMRVDSNTKGHTTWFYYKVSNFSAKQKVKFNIINFQKNGLMYKQGMKPYTYRSSTKRWEQEGSYNVEFRPKKFRYNFQSSTTYLMNSLSFMYTFSQDDEYVYFAYCVPYSYSYLMHRVGCLQKESPHFVQVDHTSFSTGGLEIPILTITNSNQERDKPCCLAVGRLHPGETQGSWMMDGFLKFICSPQGYYLREKIVFKIIPMVNVDGVVLGNFRTGIAGRDLNRVFDQPESYSQIQMIRDISKKYNPLLFLDFHGHSAKKNVFMYGPNYGVDNKYYLASRLFPKLVSKITNVFRFYSCIFRISKNKVNAGRAVMIREHNVAFSFTIEGSSFAHGTKNGQTKFTREQYCKVGTHIAEGLQKFVKIIFVLPKRFEGKKDQQKQEVIEQNSSHQQKGKTQQVEEQREQQREQSNGKKQLRQQRQHKKEQNQSKLTKRDARHQGEKLSNLLNFKKIEEYLRLQEKGLFQELLNDEKMMEQSQQDDKQDSDFEEGVDYDQSELKEMLQEGEQSEGEDGTNKKKRKKERNKKNKQLVSPDQMRSIQQKKSQKHIQSSNVFKKDGSESSQKINKINFKLRPLKAGQKEEGEERERLPEIRKVSEVEQTIQEYQSSNQHLNRVYYNNWKRELTPLEVLEKKYKKVSSSLNHIVVLDYDLQKDKQLQYELEKKLKLSREKKARSRFLKWEELNEKKEDMHENSERRIKRDYSLKANLKESSQCLLPSISKNNSVEMNFGGASLQELVSNHQKMQNRNIRKNIKILYF